MKADEMPAGMRHEGGELGHEIQRLEEDRFGPVRPWVPELVEDAPIRPVVQSLESEGRAGDVTAEVLQAFAVVARDAHVSV